MSRRRIRGWLVAPIAALVLFAWPLPAWLVEAVYSRHGYRWWQTWMTAVSNRLPFAVLDVLILAVVAGLVWRGLRLARDAAQGGVISAVWEGVRRAARAAGMLALVFLLSWGLNYRRQPLSDVLPPVRSASVDDVRAAVLAANGLAARLRPIVAPASLDTSALVTRLPQPLNAALASLDRPGLPVAGRPKTSYVLTPFFRWAGIDGMVDPFALETILYPGLLPFERPFILAHEWAHLAGAADEAEASAIGWLACMKGGPAFAYSASLYLIVEGSTALPPPVWREVSRQLDLGVRADLVALAQRQRQEQPDVQRAAFRAYDGYLRANHVGDGVASYDRALSFILSPRLREALTSYPVDRAPRP